MRHGAILIVAGLLLAGCEPRRAEWPVPCIRPTEAARASDLARSAREAFDAGDFAVASRRANRALNLMGYRYADPEALDHTGQRLSLAGFIERDGDPKGAAKLRLRILGIRLDMFAKKARTAEVRKACRTARS